MSRPVPRLGVGRGSFVLRIEVFAGDSVFNIRPPRGTQAAVPADSEVLRVLHTNPEQLPQVASKKSAKSACFVVGTVKEAAALAD
jgi:hypothetical protein